MARRVDTSNQISSVVVRTENAFGVLFGDGSVIPPEKSLIQNLVTFIGFLLLTLVYPKED